MTDRVVVVTGVSTGIGHAIARVLVGHGVRVFGSVRRSPDADRLRVELGSRFTPLIFDVTDVGAIRASAAAVADALRDTMLFGLVNNAGIAVGGPLLHQPLEEVRRHVDVNAIGALAMIQTFAPLLGTDRRRIGKPGRIVNISSVAGRISAPFLGAYAASKRALEGMSHSLRRELMLYGIDVIIVNPGSVVTPIWDKAEAADASRYAATDYAALLVKFQQAALRAGRSGLPPDAVGDVVWTALTAEKPRWSYPVLRRRLTNWTIPLALPTRLIDRLIARRLGIDSDHHS
jgi:NAD(P)-dependent dehydrogenase (short-subunit alcohol dehydrogenase family)